jgi:hypothetical protein
MKHQIGVFRHKGEFRANVTARAFRVGAGSMIKRLLEAAVGSLGYRIERKAPTQAVAPTIG